jgi:NAD(P)-dependent dehydrogenase (short-subunit alcohol dehydrogenase family)
MAPTSLTHYFTISTEGIMRIPGKVAIITGGAHGMGAEEVRLFAQEGAKVVIADILEEEGKKLEAEIRQSGGEAMYLRTDVTSEADWNRLVTATMARFGKLDILVNNAGLSSTSEADPMDTEGWRRIMEVNTTGVFLGTKYAVPAMQQAGRGSIVNISSIMGFVGGESGHPAYHASKGAVRIFTKATAVKYGPDGIRANSVHPGFMPPMRSARPRDVAAMQRLIDWTPLRRTGKPIEVAYGVLFLASDEASFITGTELVIDGGFIAQ